jgi:hypothetical protein
MDLNMMVYTGIHTWNQIPKSVKAIWGIITAWVLTACGWGGWGSSVPTDPNSKPVFSDAAILPISVTKGTPQAICTELPNASWALSYQLQQSPAQISYILSPEWKNCLVVWSDAFATPKWQVNRMSYIASNEKWSTTKLIDLFVNDLPTIPVFQITTLPGTPIRTDLTPALRDANGDAVLVTDILSVEIVRWSNTALGGITPPYDISTIAAKNTLTQNTLKTEPVNWFTGILKVTVWLTDGRDTTQSSTWSFLIQIEDPALTGVFSGIQTTTTFNTQSNYQITAFRIGTGTGTYSLKAGSALPPWLSLSPDGTISGNYIPSKWDGTPVSYVVTFMNTDATGVISEKLVTWTFQEPFILSAANAPATSPIDNVVNISGTKPSDMVFDMTYLGINITTATVTTGQDTPTNPWAIVTVLDSKHIQVTTKYTPKILSNPIITLNGWAKRITVKSMIWK